MLQTDSLDGTLARMRIRTLLVVLLGLCCMGMGKKTPPLTIRFYTQTQKGDTESFSAPVKLLNGQDTYVDQVAAISERDIAGIYPYPVADGSGACAFQLDDHGTIALDTLSVAKRGTLLIAAIDGRQVADILIDKRVSTGVITIPGGISVDEMKLILKRFPAIGSRKAEKKKKKDIYSIGL
jgi:hypothetical protein